LETAAAWVDSLNNLWFFGGQLCCSASGFIDDVWMYNTTSGDWTWMKGSNLCCAVPVYGIKGISDPLNTPGGRRIYAHWQDEANNFWIFGGQDNTNNCFNDLWKYDPVVNEWTWMKGANVINAPGSFGTQCSFDSTNTPAARMENRFYWTDSCFNFWMLGGLNTGNGDYRNDLWCYNSSINQWKWVSGASTPNQDGNYGVQGTPSPNNHPGARYGGVGWLGPGESLWLYGGVGYPWNNNVGSLNDLWRFIPDTSCVNCTILNLPVTALQSSDTSVCEKFCIDFFDVSTNNPTSWQWEFAGGTPSSSTDENPSNICYDNPGTYDVVLITTNAFGTDTLTLTNFITIYPTPAFPLITQDDTLLTSSTAANYQWQFNGIDIPGATNQSYIVTQTGFYTVLITDSNGCQNSATLYVELTGLDEVNSIEGFSIYPNPSNGNFVIEWSSHLQDGLLTITLTNTLGITVFSDEGELHSSQQRKDIEVQGMSSGLYYLEIKTSSGTVMKKIIIQ
jgi:PKD repeat protein